MIYRYIGIDIGTSSTLVKIRDYDTVGKISTPIKVLKVDGKESIPSVAFVVEDCFGTADNFRFASNALSCQLDGKIYRNYKMMLISDKAEERLKAQEIIARFIKWLRKQYEDQISGYFGVCDKEITVISYPERWPETLRTFMVKATAEAGFKNVEGMDEAQAAIQYLVLPILNILQPYGEEMKKTTLTVMLLDMGAGTTDIVFGCYNLNTRRLSILSRFPSTTSDKSYGGADFDSRLFQIIDGYLRDNGILVQDEHARGRILTACKDWKENQLSGNMKGDQTIRKTPGFVSFLCQTKSNCTPFPHIDRKWFEDRFSEEIEAFVSIVELSLKQAIKDKALSSKEEIDLVVLTGGHSQWYFIPELLKGNQKSPNGRNITIPVLADASDRLLQLPNPSETVALGLVCKDIEAIDKPASYEPASPIEYIAHCDANHQNTTATMINDTEGEYYMDIKVNLLVAGKAGVGKTTLTNAIFGQKVGKVGVGLPVTTDITKHEVKGSPFVIYDVQGFELSNTDTVMGMIRSKITDTVLQNNSRQIIHAVLYCIQHVGGKIERPEIDFIRALFNTYKVPIFIVFTKAFQVDMANPSADPLIATVKSMKLPVLGYYPVVCEKFPNTTVDTFGVPELENDLFEKIKVVIGRYIEELEKCKLKLKRDKAMNWVWGYAATNFALGAAIPAGADIFYLMGVETTMAGHLTVIYYGGGVNVKGMDVIRSIVRAAVTPMLGTFTGLLTFNEALKIVSYFFPPAILPAAIAGGIVAAGVTITLGWGLTKILDDLITGKIVAGDVKSIVESNKFREELRQKYKQSVKDLKEDSRFSVKNFGADKK